MEGQPKHPVQNVMSMWTVYDRPSDYPKSYVARRYDVRPNEVSMSASIIIAPTLTKLRNILAFDLHLTCIRRDPNDDPVILETWL